MTENPYATPHAETLTNASLEDEAIRKSHLNFEANIRAIGILYYLNAAMMTVGVIALAYLSMFASEGEAVGGDLALQGGLIVFVALLGGATYMIGKGLRTFAPWARVVAIIFAIIGLLGFPLGTILNVLILYLFFSKKGSFVFTPEYQRIIGATPHIKYKTSIIVWIALGILLALIVAVFVGAVFF